MSRIIVGWYENMQLCALYPQYGLYDQEDQLCLHYKRFGSLGSDNTMEVITVVQLHDGWHWRVLGNGIDDPIYSTEPIQDVWVALNEADRAAKKLGYFIADTKHMILK